MTTLDKAKIESEKKVLILITLSFPYTFAAEQTFLCQEIPFLAERFHKIYIVPQIVKGPKLTLQYENIKIVNEYSKYNSSKSYIQSLSNLFRLKPRLWRILLNELVIHPSLFLNPKKGLAMLQHISKSLTFSDWTINFLAKESINPDSLFIYTYWFQNCTTGFYFIKHKYPSIKTVTRTHNKDLFEERNRYAYIPFRKLILPYIDGIFPCMIAGSNYLKEKYKLNLNSIQTSYLGVNDKGQTNTPSTDGIFRIISCSVINEVKRVHFIAEALNELKASNPETKIEWIHFGDGNLKNQLVSQVKNLKNTNVEVILPGNVTLDYIINHYIYKSVDVLINVSSFEGQPVSIKEAISFGIPIIATDVGGNSEIVSSKNGILLNRDPSLDEIADAILWFIENPNCVNSMREYSRQLFLEKYSSTKVYPEFLDMIFSI